MDFSKKEVGNELRPGTPGLQVQTYLYQTNLQGLSQIHFASVHNYLDMLSALLIENPHLINIQVAEHNQEFFGYTPLHFAAFKGHHDAVDLLLRYQADFTIQDGDGSTALHLAYSKGYRKIVERILLAHRNNFNVCPADECGLSHFHIACIEGSLIAVQGFLETGSIDINAAVNMHSEVWPGCTALHMAADQERVNIVQILLDAGADVRMTDKFGMSPLSLACSLSNRKANRTKFVLLHGSQCEIDELTTGAAQETIVFSLVEHGSDVNVKDDTGKTPLLHLYDYTAFAAFKEIIRLEFSDIKDECIRLERHSTANLLIEYGADIHVTDNKGLSLLHHVVQCYTNDFLVMKIAETLLMMGADVNARSLTGMTPLFFACSFKSNWLMIQLLLDHGADPNAVENETKTTPFLHYILISRGDTLKKFIEKGADFYHQQNNGKTVLHLLFSRSKADGYSETTTVLQRIRIKSLVMIPKLLSVDGIIDVQDSAGCTALHYACLRKDAAEIKFLIHYGANINIVDNQGKTPFERCPQFSTLIRANVYRYVMNLQKAGVSFNEGCMKLIHKMKKVSPVDYDEEYRELEEILRMRKIQLDQYNTLSDLLFKRPSTLVRHMKNPKVFSYLKKENLVEIYPMFGKVLLYQFRRTQFRRKLIEPAIEKLVLLTNHDLPDNCWDKVLDNLDDMTIKNLVN